MLKKIGSIVIIILASIFFQRALDKSRGDLKNPETASRIQKILADKPQISGVLLPEYAPKLNLNGSQMTDLEMCLESIEAESKSMELFLNENRFELQKIVGDWYFDPAADRTKVPVEASISGKFLQALAQSKFLFGGELPIDSKSAMRLLQEVMKEDPTNSAPVVYAALVEKEYGDPALAQKILDQHLPRTNHFNSYALEFSRLIHSKIYSSADFIAAVSVISQLPIPGGFADLQILMENKKDLRVAQQMVAPALQKTNPWSGIDFVFMEYGIGRRILEKNGKAEGLPTSRELLDRSSDIIKNMMRILDTQGRKCTHTMLDPVVQEILRENFRIRP